MEYIYAVMLLHKAGKDIKEDNVAAVLKAAGIKEDSAKIKSLIAALDGANIEELIASGATVAAAPAASAAAPAADAAAPAAEEKKEEPQSDANAAAGLGSLF